MKKLFYILIPMTFFSCQKETVAPTGPPNPPSPIVTDSNQIDSNYSLAGQTWIITGYRVGGIGSIITTSDTLEFVTKTSYNYNGSQATYSFYTTASAYNLTLNYTLFGNVSGTIYQGNLDQGIINGLKFTDITMGSGNETYYYFWMTRQ
jgi:hypothetical protein